MAAEAIQRMAHFNVQGMANTAWALAKVGPWLGGSGRPVGQEAKIGSGELPKYALLPLRGRERFGDDVIMGSSGDRMGQMGLAVWIICWNLQGINIINIINIT